MVFGYFIQEISHERQRHGKLQQTRGLCFGHRDCRAATPQVLRYREASPRAAECIDFYGSRHVHKPAISAPPPGAIAHDIAAGL